MAAVHQHTEEIMTALKNMLVGLNVRRSSLYPHLPYPPGMLHKCGGRFENLIIGSFAKCTE